VGKLAIDPELLDFPGRLGDQELERIRRHTIEGEELLARTPASSSSPACARDARGVGRLGLSRRAQRGEIPLTARIVAVVDAYDAMVSARAYRTALLRRARRRRRLEAGRGRAVRPARGRRAAARAAPRGRA
jgi:response regulator RpfG family c-di-GMP phosphodiesterase